jgi:hypothetical protein
MDDILRKIVVSDRENSDEFTKIKKKIAEVQEELQIRQDRLCRQQNYYYTILNSVQKKCPPDNDRVYDYLISQFSDNPLQTPDPNFYHFMHMPDDFWLFENMNGGYLAHPPVLVMPTYEELQQSFLLLDRKEQVRLIQKYNTEERQRKLEWNLNELIHYCELVQRCQSEVIELQKVLHVKETKRAVAIIQSVSPKLTSSTSSLYL